LLLEDSSSLNGLEITETLVIVIKKDFCLIKGKKNTQMLNITMSKRKSERKKKERERERKYN
jgi:hypothetical protein